MEMKEWIQVSIMIGRQIIMRCWWIAGAPVVQEWITELGKVVAYEKMSHRLNGRGDAYMKKWGRYLPYKCTNMSWVRHK